MPEVDWIKILLLRAFSISHTLVWEGVDSFAGRGGVFCNLPHCPPSEEVDETLELAFCPPLGEVAP